MFEESIKYVRGEVISKLKLWVIDIDVLDLSLLNMLRNTMK